MRVMVKLIFFLLLSSLTYSKTISNIISINYSFGEKFYSYKKEIKLDILDISEDSSALTIIKSANFNDSSERIVGWVPPQTILQSSLSFNLFVIYALLKK